MNLTEAVAVNLLLVVGLALFITEAPVRKIWARMIGIFAVLAVTLLYVYWRVTETLPRFDWTALALLPWVFLLFESAAIIYEVWSLCVLIRISDHSQKADIFEARLRNERRLPTVDVLIPTYSEGREILEETLRGARRLDYPQELVRIWILDDNRRGWLQEMCRDFGVGYLARPTNEHGKAGNLNYALPRTNGEFLLVIDADFVLDPRFIFRTLGLLLYEPGVGLVQTPQHFRNPDPIQHNLLGQRAWTEEQHFFMRVAQPARESYGNAFCVGSNWIVPRIRLQELGGFPQESICEDLEITYVLKARGYRTLYLNETLALGLAPESVPEYIKQRVRWCSGTIQHLFIKTGPIRGRNLTFLDRLFYLEPILYWLTTPFFVLLLLAPTLFWFTGISLIPCQEEQFILLLLPRLIASYLIIYWLSEWKVMPPISAIHKALSAFHLTAALAKSIVAPFGSPFKVTSKGQSREGVVIQWPILRIFLGVALAMLLGIVLNISGYYQVVDLSRLSALDVIWTCYTFALLSLCALACVESPKDAEYLNASRNVCESSLSATLTAVVKRVLD